MNQVKSTGAGLLAMQHKQRSMATVVNKVNVGKAPVMAGYSMVPASKNIITKAVRSPAARNMPVVNIDDDLDRDEGHNMLNKLGQRRETVEDIDSKYDSCFGEKANLGAGQSPRE